MSISHLILALAGILLLHYAALVLRPAGSEWSTFWPASGVAVALASRFAGNASWPVILAIGVVSAIGSLLAGREPLLVLGAALTVGLEVWVGRRILRTGDDRDPRLDTPRDLVRLFLAAPVASVTLAVVAGAIAVLSRGPDVFLPVLLSNVPAHTVGILLVAPLLIPFTKVGRGARGPERAMCWVAFAAVLYVTFVIDVGVSMVFLLIAPLAWAAVRLHRVTFLWMVLTTATVAQFSSYLDHGPFVAEGVGIAVTALAIQLFDLSVGLALLTLIIVVTQRQRLAEAVQSSEELFRTTFDTSLVGMAIVSITDDVVVTHQMNPTARRILDLDETGPVSAKGLLDEPSRDVLEQALATPDAAGNTAWQGILTTISGRYLDMRVSLMASSSPAQELSVQFLDVTERVRAETDAEADLTRAAQVQRSLLPQNGAPLAGYEVSGICVPAKTVGGDFYDWYPVDGGLALTLGDIMGKGVGAGMIAATARAALRSARRNPDPTVAVGRAADTLESEVGEDDSLATLFHARLNADDGRLSFVDAGHGLVLILRADGTYHSISGDNIPLGVLPNQEYTIEEEVLGPGDMLIVISDGVLDLHDGTLDALDVVADMARTARGPRALTDLFAELFHHDAVPDDVTVLAIRRNG